MQNPHRKANRDRYSYDMFLSGTDRRLSEISGLNEWLKCVKNKGMYTFESEKFGAQKEKVELMTSSGKKKKVLNFVSYNYLGYGYHPAVKNAAKRAIDQYGLGAASSPIMGGTLAIHKKLQKELIKFMGFGSDYGVSIFATGYGTNFGTVSALMHPGSYVILDSAAHASLIDGARLSGASIRIFKHNNMKDLERVLVSLEDENVRKLICCEGVYSVDGDKGNISGIVGLARKYKALTLVDEAHSIMVAGRHGRGVSEEQGVLSEVDMIVVTFSKVFCSLGGALIAKKEITNYINLYARPRMFSAAMPPAIAGTILKVLELGPGDDGVYRRNNLINNSMYLRSLLKDKVEVVPGSTWIVPVLYKDERITMELGRYLQNCGLDAGCLFFPVVPKGKARIRLFVSSAHTRKHLMSAADKVVAAAKKFNFLKK